MTLSKKDIEGIEQLIDAKIDLHKYDYMGEPKEWSVRKKKEIEQIKKEMEGEE